MSSWTFVPFFIMALGRKFFLFIRGVIVQKPLLNYGTGDEG